MITQKWRYKLLEKALYNKINCYDYVLDVGCGNGVVSSLIKKKFGCNLVGTDKVNKCDKVPFIKISYDTFYQKFFDTALMIDMLHHVEYDEQRGLIDKVYRVSKQLLIFEPDKTEWLNFFDRLMNPKEKTFCHRDKHSWMSLLHGYDYVFEDYEFWWYPFKYYMIVIK